MSNRSGKSASVSTWYFYLGIGALAVVLVVAGFTPTYISPLLTGTLEKDTIVHVMRSPM